MGALIIAHSSNAGLKHTRKCIDHDHEVLECPDTHVFFDVRPAAYKRSLENCLDL